LFAFEFLNTLNYLLKIAVSVRQEDVNVGNFGERSRKYCGDNLLDGSSGDGLVVNGLKYAFSELQDSDGVECFVLGQITEESSELFEVNVIFIKVEVVKKDGRLLNDYNVVYEDVYALHKLLLRPDHVSELAI
jgi:hypothetical protein